MPDPHLWITLFGLATVLAPMVLSSVLGATSLAGRTLDEATTGRLCQATIVVGLLATVGCVVSMLAAGSPHESLELGEWVAIPHYHFSVKLVFDRLSLPFAVLTFALCGTISAFATRYLHREPGYNRFFVLYSIFVSGMVLTSLAGTIETLFAGWELVGLSSAMLVAYFHERPAPPRNGFRVWVVYRVSDAALLLAAVVLHHLKGEGDFDKLLGGAPWPDGHAAVSGMPALEVGLLVVVAAAGKSALVPFSGWLPRAMEGPTPSSAIFYGALSVHLGAFLLLRVAPLIETSPFLSCLVVSLGLATALYAYVVGSVQSDVKSALSFASLVQVGLIVAEIGMGFRYVALVHLLGNASLRTLQFIRAPNLLQDYDQLENALGREPTYDARTFRMIPDWLRNRIFCFALARGSLDVWLDFLVVSPFVRLFRAVDRLDRQWTTFLAGGHRDDASPPVVTKRIEELS